MSYPLVPTIDFDDGGLGWGHCRQSHRSRLPLKDYAELDLGEALPSGA